MQSGNRESFSIFHSQFSILHSLTNPHEGGLICKMSTRIDRISEEVMKALAEAMRSVKDPRVQEAMVSVVHCDVTNDLRYAKCYISVLGSEQQTKDVMKGLKSAAGWLRREVGHKVQLRYAPELVFELDQSITHGAHISEVLHELKNEGKLGEEDAE